MLRSKFRFLLLILLVVSSYAPKVFAQEIFTLEKNKHEATSLTFSADAKYLFSGGADQILQVWDMQSRTEATFYEGHTGFILATAASHDALRLATGDRDGNIRLWNTQKGVLEKKVDEAHGASITSLCFSPNDQFLISTGADQVITIWDVSTLQKVKEIKNHTKEVSCASVSPDGKYLATSGFDGFVKVWNMENWTIVRNIQPKAGKARFVAFSPDSKNLACAFEDKTVKVFDLESSSMVFVLRGHKNAVYALSYSPDGKYLASGGLDNRVKIWKMESGEEIMSIDKFYNFVSLAFSPEGKYLAVADLSQEIKVVDVTSLQISAQMYVSNGTLVMKDDRKLQLLAAAQPKAIQVLEPPVIEVIQPIFKKGERFSTTDKMVLIKGKITSAAGLAILLINGIETEVAPNGQFSKEVLIPYLESTLKIKAIDKANKLTEVDFPVQRSLNSEQAAKAKVGRYGQDYALIIGTNDYQNFNKLSNPLFDGKTIASELETSYGFKVDFVQNPTRSEIYSKLREYGRRQFSDDDQLLIFIAGHGEFDPIFSEGYIVAKDSKKDDEIKESYISHSNLRTIINNIPCRHILLTMDVCFGGTFDPFVATGRGNGQRDFVQLEQKQQGFSPLLSFSTAKWDDAERIRFIEKKMTYKTRKYMTSGGKEYVPDGRPGQHSPFARKFIEGLRTMGGDDKILTSNELFGFLETVVPSPKNGEFGQNQPGSDFLLIAK